VAFSIDGQVAYRARVNLDAMTRASDAVLEQIRPDGTPAILTDGKVTTFDAAVAERLPSQDVLLASAFSAQNKAGNFIGLKPRERKDLFSELLGLQHYETLSATARQAATLVEGARGRLQAMRTVMARDLGDDVVAALERDATTLAAAGETAQRMKRALRAQLDALEARLAAVQEAVATYTAAAQQADLLRAAIATRRSERCQLNLQHAAADTMLTDELRRIGTTRDADLADIAKRIAGNSQVLRQADDIRAAVAALAALDHELAGCRAQYALASVAETEAARAWMTAKHTVEAIGAVETELARVRSDAGLLTTVPCGGAGAYAACRFLTNAREAAAQIPELEQRVGAKPRAEAARAEYQRAYQDQAASVKEITNTIAALDRQRAAHQPLARYAEPLAAAEARLAELTDKRRRVEHDADQREREAQQRHDVRVQELTAQAAALDERIRQLHGELLTAQQTIVATEHGHAEALSLQTELADARAAWDDVVASLAHVEAGLQQLQRRRDELATKRAQLAALDAKLAPLETEVLDWQVLAQACGRTGLPVLEIDAAGPTISAYTNELLTACYGSRFTVELVTQQAKTDGKGMREEFALNVWDNERGGEVREVSDLSGGEQVVVAEALMNAIGVYVNTRSTQPIKTAWRDETTGALDPDNAVRYVEMLRKLQALGQIHHVFFVTHNAECAALADAQIQVAEGRALIVLPPFEAAA
jgi:exonuclease SbcC